MTILKAGDHITVRYSKKLEQNGNISLVSKTGVVSRVQMQNGDIVGAYVNIAGIKRGKNRYIPISSIDGSANIDRMRIIGILKSTIL